MRSESLIEGDVANKQLQRTVIGRRGRAASAAFHCAPAARNKLQRAAAELRRWAGRKEIQMQSLSNLPASGPRRLNVRVCLIALVVVVTSLLHPSTMFASNVASSASQISSAKTNDLVSPPNVITGPDFGTLMKIMHKGIVSCGGPFTAVLHWHVLPDGVIDSFVLNRPSGDTCFDNIVVFNAEEVVGAKLRITPAMLEGVPKEGWVPLAVASRD